MSLIFLKAWIKSPLNLRCVHGNSGVLDDPSEHWHGMGWLLVASIILPTTSPFLLPFPQSVLPYIFALLHSWPAVVSTWHATCSAYLLAVCLSACPFCPACLSCLLSRLPPCLSSFLSICQSLSCYQSTSLAPRIFTISSYTHVIFLLQILPNHKNQINFEVWRWK